jgi:queuine tRNA-ribosyltransferase
MKEISVTELSTTPDRALIDVREPDEWSAGHVAGATLIPLGQLPERLDEIPNDRPVFVMCHSGNRSSRAAALLNEHGFDVTNVTGGITAWQANSLPVVTGE